jgi:hypothetical protein
MAASIAAELGRLRMALAAARAPLMQVDRMEVRDGVDADLIAARLRFLEGSAAGGFG